MRVCVCLPDKICLVLFRQFFPKLSRLLKIDVRDLLRMHTQEEK